MKKYIVFIGMGFELLGIVLVSVWVGLWLEQKKPMRNLWPVLLVLSGLAAWFYRVIKLLKALSSSSETSPPPDTKKP